LLTNGGLDLTKVLSVCKVEIQLSPDRMIPIAVVQFNMVKCDIRGKGELVKALLNAKKSRHRRKKRKNKWR